MLVACPLYDQLTQETTAGQIDDNASANCVPTAIASGLSGLTGKPYDGGDIKEVVYGKSYQGATDPTKYFAYIAQQGVRVSNVTGTQDQLIQTVIRELQQGHAVLAAEPSAWGVYNWNTVGNHATHEVVFCDYDPKAGTLTAMNPWPVDGKNAFYQIEPVSWWHDKIVYGRVCPMAQVIDTPMITPAWNAAAGWLSYPAHDGIAAIVLDHGQGSWAHSNRAGLYPLGPVFYDAAGNSIVIWSDGHKSVAVKAQNWAIHLEDAMPDLGAALTAYQHAVATPVDTSAPKLASLKSAVSKALSELQAAANAAN